MLIIPMWLELTFRSRHPITDTENRTPKRYYYSPTTRRWWVLESNIIKKPCFDDIQINDHRDIIEAEKKIRETDDSLDGYHRQAEICYSQATKSRGCVKYYSWACGCSTRGYPVLPPLPWQYGWNCFGWETSCAESRVYGRYQNPCCIIKNEVTDDGFELSGVTTNSQGDAIWTTIHAVLEDKDNYLYPLYGLTVTSWLFHIQDTLTAIPSHPFSYRVCRVIRGQDDASELWEDIKPPYSTRLAVDLLCDPVKMHTSSLLSETF